MDREIAPAELPSVLYEERDALPRVSAIYFAMTADNDILYIGSAKNLRQRWRSHHRLADLQRAKFTKISWLACSLDRLEALEEDCLFVFLPTINAPWSLSVNALIRF